MSTPCTGVGYSAIRVSSNPESHYPQFTVPTVAGFNIQPRQPPYAPALYVPGSWLGPAPPAPTSPALRNPPTTHPHGPSCCGRSATGGPAFHKDQMGRTPAQSFSWGGKAPTLPHLYPLGAWQVGTGIGVLTPPHLCPESLRQHSPALGGHSHLQADEGSQGQSPASSSTLTASPAGIPRRPGQGALVLLAKTDTHSLEVRS